MKFYILLFTLALASTHGFAMDKEETKTEAEKTVSNLKKEQSPLHWIKNNNPKVYTYFNSENIEQQLKNNGTPLLSAIHYDHKKMALFFVDKCNANVNATTKNTGITAPHLAAQKDSTKILEMLIKKGASIHTADLNGDTPLHFAAFKDKPQTTAFLIKHGANINVKNKNGHTPAQLAAKYNATKALAVLDTKTQKEIENTSENLILPKNTQGTTKNRISLTSKVNTNNVLSMHIPKNVSLLSSSSSSSTINSTNNTVEKV